MPFSTNGIFGRQWRINSLLPFEQVAEIMAVKVNLEVTKHVQSMRKMERVKADCFVDFIRLQPHLSAG